MSWDFKGFCGTLMMIWTTHSRIYSVLGIWTIPRPGNPGILASLNNTGCCQDAGGGCSGSWSGALLLECCSRPSSLVAVGLQKLGQKEGNAGRWLMRVDQHHGCYNLALLDCCKQTSTAARFGELSHRARQPRASSLEEKCHNSLTLGLAWHSQKIDHQTFFMVDQYRMGPPVDSVNRCLISVALW
jgi:hypothetical protein